MKLGVLEEGEEEHGHGGALTEAKYGVKRTVPLHETSEMKRRALELSWLEFPVGRPVPPGERWLENLVRGIEADAGFASAD